MSIAAWLDRLGLGKYASLFVDNDVDLDVLRRLSESDLRELGLPLGARKRILQALAEPPEKELPTSVSHAGKWEVGTVTGPERRQITVMFSDVVGSTALAEQMDVEDLRLLVLAYQQACAEAIERYGGHIAQYLGDGVLAYFGYPQAHEDDAVRAVHAALAILDRMRETNARMLSEHGVGLEIRVGINTGLVVAGEMGAGGTREQLAVGETPNVAARIQGLAEPGTVVVSGATWRLIEGFFTAQPLGEQILKGVSRPVSAYRILGRTDATNRFEARLARWLTPLVSRDVELSFLQQRWDRTNDGEGQAVLLQGEAGIGKSRLVRAFRERLGRDTHQTITLSCSAHHQASVFYPVVEQLGRALGLGPEDGADRRRVKLEAFIERLGLPVDRLFPPLAALLGLTRHDPESDARADSTQLRRDTLDALARIITTFAQERPLLLVVEDAHWIDPSTEELVGLLLDEIQTRRVMMVLTARPEYRAPWVGLVQFSLLSLSRLSRRETEAMIRQVAGAELSPVVLAQLVARTDGVPLYVEELTKSVLDPDAIQGATLAVPATLQEALTARLDRLAPVRELIQVAALLGRVFDVDIVQEATGLERRELERALGDLVESGLVYRRSQQHGETLEFKHALIQEVALSTLVRQRKAYLHARIAEALQRLRPSLVDQNPEIVARHLTEAGDERRAVSLWRAAGELATQRSAAQEAVTHYRQASECLMHLGPGVVPAGEEAEVYLGLCGALMSAEGYRSDTLRLATGRAQQAAQASGSVALQWRAVFHAAPVFYGIGRNQEYLDMLGEIEGRAGTGEDPWLRACVLATRGIAHYNRGEFLQGAEALRAARAITRESPGVSAWRLGQGEVSVVVQCYALRCVARLGNLEEALEIGVDSECTERAATHPFSLAWALQNRATARCYVGDYTAALADAEEAIAISQRYGFSARLGTNLMRRGLARASLGDLEQGIQDFREGYRLWLGPGAVFHAAEFASELCDLLLVDGRGSEVTVILDDVDKLVEGTDDEAALADCQRLRGVLALAQPDLAEAERWLEAAIATAHKQAARVCELRATTALAQLLDGRGDRGVAVSRLRQVYGSIVQGHQAPAVRAALDVLERLRS